MIDQTELNLRALRTVAAVARSGSLSRAAAGLGIAQSAASRHLAEVELNSLGVLRTIRDASPPSPA